MMVSLNTEVLGLGVIQEEGVLFYSVCTWEMPSLKLKYSLDQRVL
jgi:hypothetical protein